MLFPHRAYGAPVAALAPGGALPASGWIAGYVDTANAAGRTFSTCSLGTVHAQRSIVVGLMGGGATTITVNGITCGGISLALIAGANGVARPCQLWIGTVPTGDTGDVVIDQTGSSDRATIEVFALYGLASETPGDTIAAALTDSAANVADTIDVLNGGSLVAIAQASVVSTATWTGASETHDVQPEASATVTAAFHGVTANEPGRALEVTFAATSTNRKMSAAALK